MVGELLGSSGVSQKQGRVYLVGGNATMGRELIFGTSEHDGTVFDGAAKYDGFGYSVAGLGDINGDGRPDLIFGAQVKIIVVVVVVVVVVE